MHDVQKQRASMPTEATTLCFHTRDAVERDDSRMTFELPADRLRTAASKVALASCEFPMVQWTVEEDWQLLWLNEGVRLAAGAALRVAARGPGEPEPEQPATLQLPGRLIPVVRCTSGSAGELVVELAQPHGLWADGTPSPALARARLVGGGDVPLGQACCARPISAVSFGVTPGRKEGAAPTHLYVGAAESPAQLCAWLQHAGRGAVPGVSLRFAYDAAEDRVRMSAVAEPGTLVRVLPDPLACMLGLATAPVRVGADGRAAWPCEPTRLWDHAALPPGFYAPCHRPMCTGQPLRLPAELEAAANRLYFPLVGQDRPPHTLIFADAAGRTLTAQVPPGRYAPDTLCAHLEAAMNAAAAAAGSADLAFTVTHEDDRFGFACERRVADRVVPARFSLLFHHPLCFDPARLGFAPQPLAGSDTYLAAQQVHVPRGTDGRPLANVLRVSEVGPQKRFRFHAAGPPPMVGAVLGGAGGGSLAVRTHVNGQPYAHGYRAGDVVALAPSPGHEGVGTPTAATLPVELSCVVLAADPDPCVLHLAAPAIPGLRDAGTAVAVLGSLEPWNLCMCKPRSLPAPMLGFPPRAVQWGIDGSVGSCRAAPAAL